MNRKQKSPNSKSRLARVCGVAALFLLLAGTPRLHAAVASPPPGTNVVGFIPRVGKLEVPLINYINYVGSNTPIGILVVLNQQFSNDMKRALYKSIYQTNSTYVLKVQRQVLIQRLQQLSSQTQSNLLSDLAGQPTNAVLDVRPLWVANMIGLQATTPVILHLASFNEVDHIHLDLPQKVLLTGPKPTWNIAKIGADTIGANFEGQPVVVTVLDTGVDYNHPDLQGNLWADANGKVGIDIPDNTTDPMDHNGHGTEVAGIIAGNGSGGIRTGVCPTARIMAVRETANLDQNTERECFIGIQYAFTNYAQILNFSSGWPDCCNSGQTDCYNPDYVGWRIAIENVSDQMLFVTGAGNIGNGCDVPFNITTPGRVPLALTVGASQADDTVWSGSCLGPVTWTNVPGFSDYPCPPGLNKPDLAAPGVAIISLELTNLGGGYTDPIDGTSFATAHVSGAAAVLLSQNPNFTPYTVRFILEETAISINGPDKPEPSAGWGRIQVDDALNYLPDLATPYDLAITNLHTDPQIDPQNPSFNQPVVVYAQWTNMGGQVLGNSEVRFFFADARKRTVADLNNGTPDPTKFGYIGSYFVPIIGPNNSMHRTNDAAVLWTTPSSKHKHWWLGAWILPGPASKPEVHPNNNGAVFEVLH